MPRITKKLLPKQLQFMRATARLVLYLGGIGSGKTLIGAWWALCRALGGRKIIVLMPTYSMGRDAFLPMLKEALEELDLREMRDYHLVTSPAITLQLVGGGTIYIRSADAPDRIRGINAHDGLMDEFGSSNDDEPYKILIGRLRKAEDAQIRITGTPTPKAWVRNLINHSGAVVIRQSTLENTFLPRSYIEDLKKQYGVGSAWYRQEILGEVVDFSTGLIEADRITVSTTPLPCGSHLVRVWDTASSGSTSADFTATVLASYDSYTGRMVIHDVQRRRGSYGSIRPWMIQTMLADPVGTRNLIEETQAGQIIAADLLREPTLNSSTLGHVSPLKDKVTRAMPFAARVALGAVTLVDGPCTRDFLEELRAFGAGAAHDDMVDCAAYCWKAIADATLHKATEFDIL